MLQHVFLKLTLLVLLQFLFPLELALIELDPGLQVAHVRVMAVLVTLQLSLVPFEGILEHRRSLGMRLLEHPEVFIRLHVVAIEYVLENASLPRYGAQRRLNTSYLIVTIPIPWTNSNTIASSSALSPHLLQVPLPPTHSWHFAFEFFHCYVVLQVIAHVRVQQRTMRLKLLGRADIGKDTFAGIGRHVHFPVGLSPAVVGIQYPVIEFA